MLRRIICLEFEVNPPSLWVAVVQDRKYPGNPQHQKVLFTQTRTFGPLGGAAAALICKYVTNPFGVGIAYFFFHDPSQI